MKWIGQRTYDEAARFQEDVIIEAGNKLGIGTTSPSEILHLESTAPKIKLSNSQVPTAYYTTIEQNYSWAGPSFAINSVSGATTRILLGRYANNVSILPTGTGNVGIGTSSPTYKLHVDNRVASTTGTAKPQAFFSGGSVFGADYRDGQIEFGNSSGLSGALGWDNSTAGVYLDNTWNNDIGFIAFRTHASATPEEVMRITGPGNVGIGITAPTQALHLPDDKKLALGTGADFTAYHNGTDTYVGNSTGHLYITQGGDDKDIKFYCDDGSGGTMPYLTLDGGEGRLVHSVWSRYIDGARILIGTGGDLALYHSGSDSYITSATGNLYIDSGANDADIIFKGTDGGADITALTLDMSDAGTAVFNHNINLPDSGQLNLGGSGDLSLVHDGGDGFVSNSTGNLTITNLADNSDIIFQSDDGSGGTTAYLTLDGSAGYTTVQKKIRLDDSVILAIGTGQDLTVQHDGNNTYLNNITGDFYISQKTADKDLILRCDDGSGGETAYLTLDGGIGYTTAQKHILFEDNVKARFGSGSDLQVYHNGSNSYIEATGTGDLYIQQTTDDADIIFQSDNGSGGVETYFSLDGSLADGSNNYTKWPDNSIAAFGSAPDLFIYHDGTNSRIRQSTVSDLIIENLGNDKDIIFKCDDGSGGLATYFSLDGSSATHDGSATTALYTNWPDKSRISLGASHDLRFYHDATTSRVENHTGNLDFTNYADDGDISFQSDDASGGVTEYFRVDGGITKTVFTRDTKHLDSKKALFGDQDDLQIYHDGSNSYINANGTGNLYLTNYTDDSDIVFSSDDGSGGIQTYFFIDGSASLTKFNVNTKHLDNVVGNFGDSNDLQIYHDGSNSYIKGTVEANDLIIQNEHIAIKSHSNENMIHCDSDGPVQLYYNGNSKLATVTGGVNITGELEADSLDIDGVAQIDGALTVGVDDTGHDVTFYGDASGEYMQWDTSEAKLKIVHTDEAVGLEVYTNASAQTTEPQLKVGRNVNEWWGAYCTDRTAHLVHRQDETSGSPNTSFEIWDSNTTDSAAYWVWRHANGSGGSLTEKMRLTKAGVLSVAELDISGNVDVDGTTNLDAVDIDGAVQIDNTLTVGVDDTGHDVKFYGATSGEYILWDESEDALRFTDNTQLRLGIDNDLRLWHNGTNSYVFNYTGNLYVGAGEADKDTVFLGDDGSGGDVAYLTLDGGDGHTIANKEIQFVDGVVARFGSGNDMAIRHTGSHSYVSHDGTGNLYIDNTADDAETIFRCDDGSGGTTAYLTLDGGLGYMVAQKGIKHEGFSWLLDNKHLFVGSGYDLRIHHNGSDSYISQEGTGSLIIRTTTNDEDIVFQCDDGSSGTATYLTLDGSAGYTTVQKAIRFDDSVKAAFGSGLDLQLYHNGSHSYIENNVGNIAITNNTDDGDIIFSSDDGSGGTTAYITIDGGNTDVDFHKNLHLLDNVYLKVGSNTGGDLQIYHNGSHSLISNQVGNLYLRNQTDDGDIIIQADDGSGGDATYMTFDGGLSRTTVQKNMQFADNSQLWLGDGPDFKMFHDGSNTHLQQIGTGNLYIQNTTDNADIIFQSDNGSGGTTAYLTLDGSAGTIEVAKEMNLVDDLTITGGNGSQLTITSGNVAWDASINLDTGGANGQWQVKAEGTDESFAIVNVDQGGTAPLTIHPTTKAVTLATPLATDQQKHLAYFEFKGYGTSDGTNYEMGELMTVSTAPFNHDTSTGSDGLTAQTIQTIMRSGGTVMPYAGTLKKFTGWVTSAGSGTVDIGIFKVTPTDDTAGNLTPVLLISERTTASGNATPNSFSQTEFGVTFEAGDIIYSAVKGGTASKAWYFTSTLEVEWA